MAAATRAAAREGEAAFRTVMINIFGADGSSVDSFNNDPYALALNHVGITTFNGLIALSEDTRKTLVVPGGATSGRAERPLNDNEKGNLLCFLQFYHECSKIMGSAAAGGALTKDRFDIFRTGQYDPNVPPTPWKIQIKNGKKGTHLDPTTEVANWRKNARPSRTDFKTFRDEVQWQKWKEIFVSTLEAQDLHHLVEETYIVTNKPLDGMQQKWLGYLE